MINEINVNSALNTFYRVGTNDEGRVVYRVVSPDKRNVELASVPETQADKFEKAYRDIMSIDANYQLCDTDALREKVRKNRIVNRTVFTFGGIVGCMVPLLMIKRSASTWKKMIGAIVGALTGLFAGFVSVLALNLPEGTYKYFKTVNTLSKIDMRKEDSFK